MSSRSAARLLGAIGSAHCVAMCGGLATALGTRQGSFRPRHLLYQLGRVSSYGAAGAIVGSLGAVAGFAFEASRWSEVLRLGTALIVVLIGLNIALGSRSRGPWLRFPERWGAFVWWRVAPLASRLPAQPALRTLMLGMLWGWLPCGLVYTVLPAAAFAGSAWAGAATMIAFGLGTLPAMLGLSFASGRLAPPGATLARLFGSVIVARSVDGLHADRHPLRGSSTHAYGEGQLAYRGPNTINAGVARSTIAVFRAQLGGSTYGASRNLRHNNPRAGYFARADARVG